MKSATEQRLATPQRQSWRAGYVILPVAFVVGVLQILAPSPRSGMNAPEGPHQLVSTSDPSPISGGAGDVQETEPQPRERPLLNSQGLTRSASAADEVGAPEGTSLRIVIHHAAGPENALPAIQLAAFLQERGFEVTDILPVDREIERPRVRYFFVGDQPGVRPLIEAVAAFFAETPDQMPDEVADLEPVSPEWRRGDIEVWLPTPAGNASQPT